MADISGTSRILSLMVAIRVIAYCKSLFTTNTTVVHLPNLTCYQVSKRDVLYT